MKHFVACMLFILICLHGHSQSHSELKTMLPKAEFENILVRPISSDSLSSSFLIWIKDKVKAHRHITHTEQVYVLEGAGMMHLGDSTYRVSSGSFINIPKNTVHSVTVTSHLPMKVLSIQSPLFTGIDRHFIE